MTKTTILTTAAAAILLAAPALAGGPTQVGFADKCSIDVVSTTPEGVALNCYGNPVNLGAVDTRGRNDGAGTDTDGDGNAGPSTN